MSDIVYKTTGDTLCCHWCGISLSTAAQNDWTDKEIIRIDNAIEKFSVKMIYRMRTKMLQGFTGWADESKVPDVNIIDRMRLKTKGDLTQKDLIDIANFAMMLWWRKENT